MSFGNSEWEQRVLPSGLIVATSAAPSPTGPEALPAELHPPRPAFLVPRSTAPQPTDLLLAAPAASDLEYPAPTLGEVIELLRDVPFESAIVLVSLLAAEIYHHPRDAERQLRYAADLFWPAGLARVREFVADDPSHLVFDLRLVLALQCLLIMHADPDPEPEPARGLTRREIYTLAGALLGLGDALPRIEPPEPHDDEEPDWSAWSTFFAQSAVWYDEPYVLEAVARSYAAFSEIAASPELAAHPARTEVEQSMTATYGLDLAEQLGVGLACGSITRAFEPDVEPGDRARHIAPGFLSLGLLADREGVGLALLSATREHFRDTLRARGDRPEQVAWDHSVLEQYPLICLPGDRYILLSPRALVSWMTRGMHYRLLDAAGHDQDEATAWRERGRFLTFAGALGEQYVLRLARRSLRHAVAAGAVQVQGEVEYYVGRDRRDSPDVAILSMPDLVLIEVYSGRMSLEARTRTDPEALQRFVQRAVADKLAELQARVHDVLGNNVRYDDFDLAIVRSIWPVLVLAGDSVPAEPLLWGHLRSSCPRCFNDDARVRRPIICDLDDLESVLALAEEGHHVPYLLSQFLASGAGELPVRNWISRTYGLERRPAYVDERYRLAMNDVRSRLFGAR